MKKLTVLVCVLFLMVASLSGCGGETKKATGPAGGGGGGMQGTRPTGAQ